MHYGPRPDNTLLRAALVMIEKAQSYKDRDLMDSVYEVVYELPVSTQSGPTLRNYLIGVSERVGKTDGYFVVDDQTLREDRRTLMTQAYGDFKEALIALDSDLLSIDPTIRGRDVESDIFHPLYFSNDAERHAWRKYRTILEAWQKSPSTDFTKEAEETRLNLRAYMQTYFGPLVPVMTATYVHQTEKGKQGYTVRLIWKEDCLTVTTTAPFYEELDNYFIEQHPVSGMIDFNERALPKEIGGFTLMDVDSLNLFAHEL